MISSGPAGRPTVRMRQHCNVAIFSDTTNMINVKLCMMVVLIELYPHIPLSVTPIVFQGHSSVKLNMLCSSPIKLKLCMIVDYVK